MDKNCAVNDRLYSSQTGLQPYAYTEEHVKQFAEMRVAWARWGHHVVLAIEDVKTGVLQGGMGLHRIDLPPPYEQVPVSYLLLALHFASLTSCPTKWATTSARRPAGRALRRAREICFATSPSMYSSARPSTWA